jgi:hypothetical protein
VSVTVITAGPSWGNYSTGVNRWPTCSQSEVGTRSGSCRGGRRYPPWSVGSGGFRILYVLSTESPQPVHYWCTASTTCPHDVEAVLATAALWCRVMRLTPTYDQLRDERLNADVPASEAGTQVDHPGRHRLRDDAPAAAAVGGSSSGPGADLAEDWSWFVTGDPVRTGSAHTTRSVHSSAGTHRREQAPHEFLPPPTHARNSHQQHKTVGTSLDTKADPLENRSRTMRARDTLDATENSPGEHLRSECDHVTGLHHLV